MTDPTAADDLVPLADGLVLRQARAAELDQIGALLTDRGEPGDALDHRLVVQDPDLGWPACAVVVDGERVVSTATLLDEVIRVGDVLLPAGQVELVATDRAYEGRGLVRALMAWAHRRSAARGQLLQIMIGIPYFYRLFGYEYAIDINPARPAQAPTGPVGAGFRPAREEDLPGLAALQQRSQAGFDLAVPHPAARWRWLLHQDASELWVLERAGNLAAGGRVRRGDDELLLAEAAADDEPAALDLLRGVAGLDPDAALRVVERPGTLAATAWRPHLDHEAPQRAEEYYVRIPDAAALLDRLRPLFWRRLAGAGLDAGGRDLVISTFGAHYRLPTGDDGLGPVITGGPMQSPGVAGAVGVAPDQLGALLFGPRGLDGLTRLRPDVYAADAEFYGAIFPPLTADVLSYYLPY
ncbi:GNAT family N-acetyltransferase [Microlunatus parietis]|uniref:Putative N-acetyltransferase YhbS n=1 Tax=Microlunatus parietis TaxID=682979 RepID=A0A7Y9LA45_9ACTN|nr:GNAT family N-acetyltransferase [Microlunatus parietis]NYE69403.1 putative N-acetyltransferase YhbS [Microlunatus parietis]